MKSARLYRYFDDRRWAEAFVAGQLRFRSQAYFRDLEEQEAERLVRRDPNEGRGIYAPEGGLVINNQTQGTTIVTDRRFVSDVKKPGEILVYCLSRRRSTDLWGAFGARACVEILNIAAFCNRVTRGLPPGAQLGGKPGRERLGRRVAYYNQTQPPGTRWALPDDIAASKLDIFAWQDEFRLLFSQTDALAFQNVTLTIAPEEAPRAPRPDEHHHFDLQAASLDDICIIHDAPA